MSPNGDGVGGPGGGISAARPAAKWSDQEEYLLSLWADRALCYKILHEDAQRIYKRQHMWFSIPVIVLATLAGTANVAIASYVPSAYISTAQLVIGGVNLFCGVLSTLSNYFRAAEKCESHRNASVGWGKLYRSIFVELSLARDKRKPVTDFMRLSKNEYDRLTDNDPSLRSNVFKEFTDKVALNHSVIILPEECGNLLHTSSWEHVANHRLRVLEARGSIAEEKDTLLEQKDTLLELVKPHPINENDTAPIIQANNTLLPGGDLLSNNPLYLMGSINTLPQVPPQPPQPPQQVRQQVSQLPQPPQPPQPPQQVLQQVPQQVLPQAPLPLPIAATKAPQEVLDRSLATSTTPVQLPPQVNMVMTTPKSVLTLAVEAPAAEAPAASVAVDLSVPTVNIVAEAPAAKVPAVETPAAKTPAAKTPAVETPAVETPAVKAPAVKAPAAEAPALVPAAEVPALVPAAEVPVVVPAAETSAIEAPAEAPAIEAPAEVPAEAPTVVPAEAPTVVPAKVPAVVPAVKAPDVKAPAAGGATKPLAKDI
jgi:hypothetical protein